MMLVGGARGRAAAGRARHHAPRAEGCPGGHHARSGRGDARHRRRRAPGEVRARRPADRGLRPEPARRRGRTPGTGGNRRHRSGHRRRARRGTRRDGSRAGRHGVRAGFRAALRRDRRHVPRSGLAGAQGGELRPGDQRDARAAVHSHLGRSRHGARPRRRRRQRRATRIPAACSPRWISRSSWPGAPTEAVSPGRACALNPAAPARAESPCTVSSPETLGSGVTR